MSCHYSATLTKISENKKSDKRNEKMVDEITPAVATATTPNIPTAPAAPASTTENPSPSPVVETVVSNETTAPSEPAKVETAPEAVKTETLLGTEKKEEPKVELKPEEKPAEVKVEEKVSEQPKYEWKVPEGAKVDETKIGEFNKMLGDFQLNSKLPQEEVQKLGQQMLDRHQAEMQRYTEALTTAWNKQANDWKDSFLKSPEFANRTDTVLNAAIDAINTYGGTPDQQKEFRELMESSKIGNHPAMIRMLSNIMMAKPEPKPLAAPQIATPAKRSKIEAMYGKKTA